MKWRLVFYFCIQITASFILLPFLFCNTSKAQAQKKKVLFLGNSYTAVNNLPKMIADMAMSMGDTLLYGSNTPGGYTLRGHSTNTLTKYKIAEGNWDYVVLQEQSQLPSYPQAMVDTMMFPYADSLNRMIKLKNPCSETMFFMTWGRKNGDASNCSWNPPVCTYRGMDSLLYERYSSMAYRYQSLLSPVGAVWHYIRNEYPGINLYNGDGSHPSAAGTYAAACTFYATLFRKDPSQVPFNSTLPPQDAANIKLAAKLIVFDSLLKWHVSKYDPKADFNFNNNNQNSISFINESSYANQFEWDFGDGQSSAEIHPVHIYNISGTYTVTLTATSCQKINRITKMVNVRGIVLPPVTENDSWGIFPNPASTSISISAHFSGNLKYRIYDRKAALVHK